MLVYKTLNCCGFLDAKQPKIIWKLIQTIISKPEKCNLYKKWTCPTCPSVPKAPIEGEPLQKKTLLFFRTAESVSEDQKLRLRSNPPQKNTFF